MARRKLSENMLEQTVSDVEKQLGWAYFCYRGLAISDDL